MALKLEIRQKVYEKCNGRCGYCGCELTISRMQIDHIWPQFSAHLRPGFSIHGLENLMPSCARCNRWKSTFPLDAFRREITLQIERLNKYSANYRLARDFGLVKENGAGVEFYFEKITKPE